MSTVGDLVDRTFRGYLEPPDAQPAAARLLLSMTAVSEDLSLSGFEVPEDSNLMRIGSIVEIGAELMRVLSWDSSTLSGTVERGVDGSESMAHSLGARVKLAPRFPRLSVWEAVRDNIIGLYPDLWTTRTELMTTTHRGIYAVDDDLAVEIVEMNPDQLFDPRLNVDGRMVEYHQITGGRAIIAKTDYMSMWVRYRRRFGVATDEETDVADLGVESVWETIVCVGAAADLMAGRDIPKAHADWVGSVLEAENVPVGTKSSLAVGLARYRELLIDRFGREMRAEESNKVRVSFNDPFMQVG